MSLANALKKAATKTLSKLGGDVTIRKVTAGSYNTTKGVLENVTRSQVNDLIEQQDKLLTISANDLDYVPTTKDRVVISSVEFKIISVVTNEQNNTPISFELVLR